MLLENLVTRRVSEENASNSSLTRRVTKQGYLLLAALVDAILGSKKPKQPQGKPAGFGVTVHPYSHGFAGLPKKRQAR